MQEGTKVLGKRRIGVREDVDGRKLTVERRGDGRLITRKRKRTAIKRGGRIVPFWERTPGTPLIVFARVGKSVKEKGLRKNLQAQRVNGAERVRKPLIRRRLWAQRFPRPGVRVRKWLKHRELAAVEWDGGLRKGAAEGCVGEIREENTGWADPWGRKWGNYKAGAEFLKG